MELVKRFEIKEAIYFDTAMDRANPPHVPHRLPPRKRWIVVHVRKKYACIIGCETILARVESRFITCQLFQIKENLLLLALARARTSLFKGRKKFFLPFFFVDPLERATDAIKTLHLDGRQDFLIFLLTFR